MDDVQLKVAEAIVKLDDSMAETCEAYRVAGDVVGYRQTREHHRAVMADFAAGLARAVVAEARTREPVATELGKVIEIDGNLVCVDVGGQPGPCRMWLLADAWALAATVGDEADVEVYRRGK